MASRPHCGPCPAHQPPGFPGPLLQSCSPASPCLAASLWWVLLSQAQNLVLVLAEFQEVPFSPFLQGSLDGSPALKDINCLPSSLVSPANCMRGHSVASSRSWVQVLQ